MIPTLWILSILVFLSVRFIPGDAIDVWVAKMAAYGEALQDFDREDFMRFLGLDVPVHVQYGRWIGVLPTPDWVTGEAHFRGLLQGTLGESMGGSAASIEDRLIGRLPVTIQLGVMAIVIGLLIALPVGIYSAIRQDTAADYAGRTTGIIGMSVPNFWAGNHGHDLPGSLVGLVATAGVGSFHRRPTGKSQGVIHSQPDSGHRHVCGHDAVDAHHDAGGAQARLYQNRLVQGSQ